jgi:hypothetical protein
MAKKQEEYITVEATRIGYQIMLGEIEELLTTELSQAQKISLNDQQSRLKELLNTL